LLMARCYPVAIAICPRNQLAMLKVDIRTQNKAAYSGLAFALAIDSSCSGI
jgi:hypothetical protein